MRKKAVIFSASEYGAPQLLDDLPCVASDALAMEKRLNQIGFEVVKKYNSPKNDYIPTLEQCVDNSPSDAIHIVYFSGHGGNSDGENLIFPADFVKLLDSNHSIKESSINIKDIISVFHGKGRLLLIIDACRKDTKVSRGYFSEMTLAENVYIAYATTFNNLSSGRIDGLSWFTEAVCDEILAPNIDVDMLFTRVRRNMLTKHRYQLSSSVNALLEPVILHPELSYDDDDIKIYNFVKKYGDEYLDKYGYFHGDDLIFVDAAQYYGIGLLDAIWKFKKVDNKIYKDKGIHIPELTEDETKIDIFLGLEKSKKFFYYDESHTWYYNGRQIRMGEIPPLPTSMQQTIPEESKAIIVEINAIKVNDKIIIETNLPDSSEIFVFDDYHNKSCNYIVTDGKIEIGDAKCVSKIFINSVVNCKNEQICTIIGNRCCNLIGELIKYNPIYGNRIQCEFSF